jgi:hypothetical protein
MNEAWLDQWADKATPVLRRAVADVAKSPGGGNASLPELMAYIARKGGGAWTLLETQDEYIVIKAPAPVIRLHLGKPTLV